MSRFSQPLVFVTLALLIGACQYFPSANDEQGTPVARVYDSYLFQEDLEEIVPTELKGDDSAQFVQNYLNVWAKNELMIYKAEFNLTEEQKEFEEQIANYRNDLLKFAYLQKYVDDRLDTTITEEQILNYYQQNKENFVLKENILKFRYLSVPADAPDQKDIDKWFKSGKEEDQEALLEYALKYSRGFSLQDTSWVSYGDLARLIPLQTYNEQEFLARNDFFKVQNDSLHYFVDITEYKIKDGSSPLNYVRDIIKNTLINRRRLELISELEKGLLSDAIKKKEFEVYP